MTKLKQALIAEIQDHFKGHDQIKVDEGNVKVKSAGTGVIISLHATDDNGESTFKVLERYAILLLPQRLLPYER